MDIMEKRVNNSHLNRLNLELYQFDYALDMMKNNKENFENENYLLIRMCSSFDNFQYDNSR